MKQATIDVTQYTHNQIKAALGTVLGFKTRKGHTQAIIAQVN